MPIERIGGAGTLAGATPSRRRQSGFAVPDTPAAEAPAEAAAAAAIPHLTLPDDTHVATQHHADAEAASQGEAMLGAMRNLQLAMLGGGAAQAELEKLAGTLPAASDPKLDAVLQAIAQRAAVERARRE